MKRLLNFLKSRKPDFWYRIIICVCIIIFGASLTKLIFIFREYKAAQDEYANIEEEFTSDLVPGVTATGEGIVVEEVDENGNKTNKTFIFKPLNVDFASLKKTNKDVIGWIQFETFSLSYPILNDSSGGEYYLTHTFQKKENKSGAIFIVPPNSKDFSDSNTVIFGHNMKDGSMFGLLGRYKTKAYYEYNKYFRIYTPSGMKRYQIFSVYKAQVDGSAFSIMKEKNDAYGEILKELKANSMYNTGVNVSKSDTIVTLCTCTSDDKNKRLVVHAKLIQ